MNIYKVKIGERGFTIPWAILYGIAGSIEEAMQKALKSENEALEESGKELDDEEPIKLEVLSAELVSEVSFNGEIFGEVMAQNPANEETYEFDARISVMAGSDSKAGAADKILDICLDSGIAISLSTAQWGEDTKS